MVLPIADLACPLYPARAPPASISPDGRTLLSVGDSPDVYLHRISGSSRLGFAPIARLSLSPHIADALAASSAAAGAGAGGAAVPASFSTAFSGDGSKFAVASQEGVVVVWDVRSTKPLKVFQTDKTRASVWGAGAGVGGMGGGMGRGGMWWATFQDTSFDWTRANASAPGWGVRSVKFSPRGVGREVMTFTEVRTHTLAFVYLCSDESLPPRELHHRAHSTRPSCTSSTRARSRRRRSCGCRAASRRSRCRA